MNIVAPIASRLIVFVSEGTCFEALAQYFIEGSFRDVLRGDVALLSARVSAVHLRRLHPNAALCVDALAGSSSGRALLVSHRRPIAPRLAVSELQERQTIASADLSPGRMRSVCNPPAIPARTAKQ